MDYQETIDWLYSQLPMFSVVGPGAYKPGLNTTRMLDDAFGNPHTSFKSIHVGGTNGKGSTSHSIAAVLQSAGYKVGLFTSPHLVDFRERIRVNGEKIGKGEVIDFVERFKEKNLACAPSFFELTTIMAFDYFAKEKVDYAVIEVGLGGRLDSTNIIEPELCVITNISLDHVALLGNTLEEIAFEKAGIIKPMVPVIIGEANEITRKVFVEEAHKLASPILFAEDKPYRYSNKNGKWVYDYDGTVIESDLTGSCQPKNANTVLAALKVLGVASTSAIVKGLSNVQKITGLMGRWMKISDKPTIVCDTGHNIGAWEYLSEELKKVAFSRKLRVVLGFSNDKDVEAIFKLLPKEAEYYFVAPNVQRARCAEDLLVLAKDNDLVGRSFPDVKLGFQQAVSDSSEEDFIFIGGSNFVVAEVL